MLAKLDGKVIDIFDNFIILNCNGVGYKVEITDFALLVGQEVSYYIHTHVRENEIRLFGIKNREKYLLFMDLIEVQGVGPKAALSIIGELSIDTILSAISNKTPKALQIKGIGKKTAEKIIIELYNKVDKYHFNKEDTKELDSRFINEAKEALLNLGFTKTEVNELLQKYQKSGEGEDLQKLIKYVLSNKNE
mgnify:CR=1 FL=1